MARTSLMCVDCRSDDPLDAGSVPREQPREPPPGLDLARSIIPPAAAAVARRTTSKLESKLKLTSKLRYLPRFLQPRSIRQPASFSLLHQTLGQRLRSRIYYFLAEKQSARRLRRHQRRQSTSQRILKMAQGLSSWVNPSAYLYGSSSSTSDPDSSQQQQRAPGTRRARLAGALRAANEARQNYIANYYRGRDDPDQPVTSRASSHGSGEWTNRDMRPSGTEEMILFPSYARRRKKGHDDPAAATAAAAPFHESPSPPENITVAEIDVRGWIFEPPSNVLTRKNRFLMGAARQLCGLPAQGRGVTEEDRVADMEAASRLEAGRLDEGGLSDDESIQPPRPPSVRSLSPAPSPRGSSTNLSELGKAASEPPPQGIVKKLSWRAAAYASSYMQPRSSTAPATGLTAKELDTAHEFLKHRMFHVMARASPNVPVTIFFYNEQKSESHTITTDAYGQFALRAELKFVPTNLRVLASERLSATEQVCLLESHGISLISDIDDTIKDSAVTAGVREMARNVFVRDYNTLTIPGITELYNTLAFLDVPIHYVSNSPWQLYPLIREYFKAANLPSGSFHLKQYQSVFQGLFEPVADRKKGSLERILQDFPDRRFIMVGDSGEADLEVYVTVALANPGRIKAIFIRDVTTKEGVGFFQSNNQSTPTLRPQHSGSPHRRPNEPPRVQSAPPQPAPAEENLLDFSSSDDDDGPMILKPMEGHTMYAPSESSYRTAPSTNATAVAKRAPPPPPKKPTDLKGKKLLATNHFARTQPRAIPADAYHRHTRPAGSDNDDLIDLGADVAAMRLPSTPHSPPNKSPSPPKVWKAETSAIFDNPHARAVRPHPSNSFSSPNLPLPPRRTPQSNNADTTPTPKFTIRPPTDSDKSTTTISRTNSEASSYHHAHQYGPNHNNNSNNGGSIYSNPSNAGSAETWDPSSGMDKKEWLWNQRWQKAEAALRAQGQGVMLVSWKRGGDILEMAVKVVEEAKSEMDHRSR
ncbi:hypothetical protein Dda_1143 [Drechslerella dactyloides]|uniref:Phosphatidate phosphatase APP1 catalytic domain-containing protein n=1 Tax=Drechslerella dactyloides TaxID=74499 RepID=A0AAD6J5N0_DREDA|nr:hypothetical protein Dda_1143 [Drechslerella dactyloides]